MPILGKAPPSKGKPEITGRNYFPTDGVSHTTLRLTFRHRVTFYLALNAALLLTGSVLAAGLAGLASLLLHYLLQCLYYKDTDYQFVPYTVEWHCDEPLRRNAFYEAFSQSDDVYGSLVIRTPRGDLTFENCNYSLAVRAADSCSWHDSTSLRRYIQNDRSRGSDYLRSESFEPTIRLASLISRKRDQIQEGIDRQTAWSAQDLMLVLKRRGITAAPIVLCAFLRPWLFLPDLVLHYLLFPGDLFAAIKGVPNTRIYRSSACYLHSRLAEVLQLGDVIRGKIGGLITASRRVVVYQVGPSIRVPMHWAHGPLEFVRSIIHRSARKVPKPDPDTLTAFAMSLDVPMAWAYPETPDYDAPLDVVALIESMAWPSSKKRAYLRAWDKIGREIGNAQPSLRQYAAFIKSEFYPNYDKEPRIIACPPIQQRLAALVVMHIAADTFFTHNDGVNFKHYPASKRPAAIERRFEGAPVVYGWDFSAFEASISPEIERVILEALYKRIKLPDIFRKFIDFEKVSYRCGAVTYVGPHQRRSGDYWTSWFNSLINLCVQYYAGGAGADGVQAVVVEGDDSLVAYSRTPIMPIIRSTFASLGFIVKDPEAGLTAGQAGFCSTRWGVDKVPTRDPRNIVSNIGWTFSPTAASNPGAAFADRCLAYSYDCPQSPVTWALAKVAAELKADPERLAWWYRSQAVLEHQTWKEPTPSQRAEYAELWRCPIEIQLDIENSVLHGTAFSGRVQDWLELERPDYDLMVYDASAIERASYSRLQ